MFAAACSTSRSLNAHVLAVTRQHRPSDARKFVGQRYDHDIAVRSCEQGLKPTAERRTFLGETRKSRARPVDEQHPQVAIAAFDAQQPRFPLSRRLTRDQT